MVDCHIRLPLGDVRIKELWARDLPINLASEFSVQAYGMLHTPRFKHFAKAGEELTVY